MERLSGGYNADFRARRQPVVELIPVEVGREKILADGSKLSTKSLNPINLNTTPSETSNHEMAHTGVAIMLEEPVDKVTRVPNFNEGYLGVTILKSKSLKPSNFATIAAASFATGHTEGSESDQIKAQLSGADVHAASSVARSIATQNEEEFYAAACALEERGTLTGGEVIEIFDRVRRGDDVEVNIKYPNGETRTKIVNGVKGDTVMVDREWVSIDNAQADRRAA